MGERPVTLEFKAIPLIEVAVRFTIGPPLIPVDVALLADVAGKLRESGFTTFTDLDQSEVTPGQMEQFKLEFSNRVYGARFSNPVTQVSFAMQPDLLVARWVRGGILPGTTEGSDYPRYHEGLRPALKLLHDTVASFLGEEGLPVRVANMSYLNLVKVPATTVGYAAQYVRGVGQELLSDSDSLFHTESSVRNTKGQDLRIRIQGGALHEGTQAFVITHAGGICSESGALRSPFDSLDEVHEALINFFEATITDHAKAAWEQVKQ